MRLYKMRMQQAAEALAEAVDKLLPRAAHEAPRPADHLERSTDSVLFNMAEGLALFKPRTKIAAYDIARKEANEVRAVLRRLVMRRVFTHAEIRNAHELAGACVGMLTSAIITLESRAREE